MADATAVRVPPAGRYSYELKYDGYRALALKVGGDVRLLCPRGGDSARQFPELAQAIARLVPGDFVLDGEVIAVDEGGVPSRRLLALPHAPLSYVAFDLLWLDGRDLRGHPIEERRALLVSVLGRVAAPVALSRAVDGELGQVMTAACRAGFSAVIGKRVGSLYRPGRGDDWIKLPCDAAPTAARPRAPSPADDMRPVVAGVSLSHPERVLGPLPLRKLDLARYYEAVADWMLPHVQGRPLTLVRWAEGKTTEKGGVYLRHAKAWGPSALRRVRIQEQKKVGEYLVVDDVAGLVALAQMDIVEIHTSNVIDQDLDRPNRVVFDLDPDPSVGWPQVIEAALALRAVLRGEGLESWVKSTGGKGLHVVVPLVPTHDWATCHAVTRAIAARFAAADPEHFVATVPKDKRRGKILIDYLRNNRGNTSVAAFSTRANARATVSAPLHWDELSPRLRNDQLTVASIRARLASLAGDPWAGYWIAQQSLPARFVTEPAPSPERRTP